MMLSTNIMTDFRLPTDLSVTRRFSFLFFSVFCFQFFRTFCSETGTSRLLSFPSGIVLFLLILGVSAITWLEIGRVSLFLVFKTSLLFRLRMKIVPCLISVTYLFVLYLLVILDDIFVGNTFERYIYNDFRMYVPIRSLSVGFFVLIPCSGTMLDLVEHLKVFLTDPKACQQCVPLILVYHF